MPSNEQRLAAVAGILMVAGEHGHALDKTVRTKVTRLLDAPGPLPRSDAMLE